MRLCVCWLIRRRSRTTIGVKHPNPPSHQSPSVIHVHISFVSWVRQEGLRQLDPNGNVVTSFCRKVVVALSDVEALVPVPLVAVAVWVLETEVVVVAEFFGENVVCDLC